MSGYDNYANPDNNGAPGDESQQSRIEYAKNRVRVPAVIMLVFSSISLIGVPLGTINFVTLPQAIQAQRDQVDKDPNMPAGQKQQVKQFLDMYENLLMMILPFSLGLQLIVGIISVIGEVKMLKVSSRVWAMTAAILNAIAIGHGCCFLTLPLGIWAIIVLLDARVKDGFEAMQEQKRAQEQNPDQY